MAAKHPVALILGAGSNIGNAVVKKLASKGYKVALVARSLDANDSTADRLNISSDLSKTEEVEGIFAKVKEKLGTPSVVVYNASTCAFSPADDPFAISLDDFKRDAAVNITSAFASAQQAVAGFRQLPESAARTFIYTGNVLNVTILPKMMSQGVGKSGGAHMIRSAAAAYQDKGYKFYYVDERKEDGSPKYRVDGEAHADLFFDLAHTEGQGPWMQTFVKGVGYKDFDGVYSSL